MEKPTLSHFRTFTIPYPVSGNRSTRFGKGRVYTDKKVIAYRKQLALLLLDFKQGIYYNSYIRFELDLYPPDFRHRDIDNPIKCLFDALEYAGVIKNDKAIKQERVEMHNIYRETCLDKANLSLGVLTYP